MTEDNVHESKENHENDSVCSLRCPMGLCMFLLMGHTSVIICYLQPEEVENVLRRSVNTANDSVGGREGA